MKCPEFERFNDCHVQVDLTGGFYDAGDNVKFGFPLAFTISLLAWDVVEFGSNLRTAGQLQNTLNNIRWGTDYLLKACTGQSELWVQVSDLILYENLPIQVESGSWSLLHGMD